MKKNIVKLIFALGFLTFCDSLSAQKQRIDSLVIKNGSQSLGKVLISDANGNATWANPVSPSDSTTAANGITLNGKVVELGGALTKASTITTSAANTLSIAGLQSGASADSILVVNPSTGLLGRRSTAALLGGSTSNTLTGAGSAFTSTVNGIAATLTPAAGTITNTLGFDATGNVVRQSAAAMAAGNTTNTLTGAGSALTSTVNGVAATLTPAAGTITNTLGFDATGNVVRQSAAAMAAGNTTNTLTGAGSALSSTVNGVVAALTPATGTIASGSTLGFDVSGNLVKGLGNSSDSTSASNGLTLTGKDVRLGGSLTAATTVTTSASNTLALAGLQSGTTADSIVMVDGTTGVLKKMATAVMSDKTQTNNGLSKSGDTVQFGGALTKATTVTTSATNTLALAGLQSGTTADSIVMVSSTGVLKRMATTVMSDKTQTNNGLSKSGDTVQFGGALTKATTVTTSATNTLALAGLQSGTTADSIVMVDGTTGVLKKMATAVMSDKTQTNNGLSKSGDTVQFGGALTKATTVTTSATNTLAIAGLQSGASTDSILVANPSTGLLGRRSTAALLGGSTTNTLTSASNAISSTVNGVAATLTPTAGGTVTENLGFNASGALVRQTVNAANTPNIYTTDGTLTGNRAVTMGANTLAFDTSTLFINPTNNRVGIGTTSPTVNLDVRPILYAINQNGGIQVGTKGGEWLSSFNLKSDATGVSRTTIDVPLNATGGSREAISIMSETGRVGIGTTTPTAHLQVNGDTAGTWGSIVVSNNGGGKGSVILEGANANNTGYIGFRRGNGTRTGYIGYDNNDLTYLAENGADHAFLGGNVGIGTQTPSTILHVNSSTSPAFRLVDGTQGVDKVLTSDANGNASWVSNITTPLAVFPLTASSTTWCSSSFYTGTYIDLPPGKWSLDLVLTIDVMSPLAANAGLIVGVAWSSSSASYIRPVADYLSPAIQYVGTVSSPQQYGFIKGTNLINNSTTSTKRYFLWKTLSLGYNGNCAWNIAHLGRGVHTEDNIVAYRIY